MSKNIDWFNEEKEYRDLGLTWMSHGNCGNFLETHESYNKKQKWLYGSPDVEDSYKRLIQEQIPSYWRYHNDTVIYNMNSDGFRSPEFDRVDWRNSYVILGCSHIQGIGTTYENTIGEFIARKLATPVINIGVGGASNQVIYNNLLKQIDTYGKAKGYFIMWTYPNRYIEMGRYYMQEGFKDFWARGDIVPGLVNSRKLTDSFQNELFYKRNIIWHSTKQLLQGTPVSFIWEPHCWALEDEGDSLISIPLPKRDNFTTTSHSHKEGIAWCDQPDSYKKWYLNEICARDILKYDTKSGPHGCHWGPTVNSRVAKYLMGNLK